MLQKTWLIYALGGGWGHLNRSLALARVAATEYHIKIITNSYYSNKIKIKNCEIITISSAQDFKQTKAIIQKTILQSNYDCLIIDTFPCGLGGELRKILPIIPQPKIFINRYLNPRYIKTYQLEKFVTNYYNLILIPGENNSFPFINLPKSDKTYPWLIRNSDELPNLSLATTLLGLTPEQAQSPLVIILASGYNSELAVYGKIAATLHQQGHIVRCISAQLPPNCPSSIWQFHYPAIECLWLANVVIGGGGYNTVFECNVLNIPLVALPHKRLYDCQRNRIVTQQQLGNPIFLAENSTVAIKLTQQLLSLSKSKPIKPPKFLNGVTMARDKIIQIL